VPGPDCTATCPLHTAVCGADSREPPTIRPKGRCGRIEQESSTRRVPRLRVPASSKQFIADLHVTSATARPRGPASTSQSDRRRRLYAVLTFPQKVQMVTPADVHAWRTNLSSRNQSTTVMVRAYGAQEREGLGLPTVDDMVMMAVTALHWPAAKCAQSHRSRVDGSDFIPYRSI